MKKENDLTDDLLKRFLNNDSSEKAPHGFTERMMNQLTAEALPLRKKQTAAISHRVPLISAVCIAMLVILAITTGKTGNGISNTAPLNFINNISFRLPDINFEYSGFRIPEITFYIMSLSFFLLILDLYLFRHFRKGKSITGK